METGTLKELNVQPGDVVKVVGYGDNSFGYYLPEKGAEATMTDSGHVWGMSPNRDDTVYRIVSRANPTGPVRTGTRKELVCGTYGNVYVEKYDDRLGASMEFSADPERIRAAIATLTEIADALEGGPDV